MKREYLYHGIAFIIWVTLNVGTATVPAPIRYNADGSANAVYEFTTEKTHSVRLEIASGTPVTRTVLTSALQFTIADLESIAKARIDKADRNDPAYILTCLGFSSH